MSKLVKIALILLIIGISGTVATASVTDVFSFDTVKLEESNEVNGDKIKKIDVITSSTDINVVPTKNDEIKVNFSGEVSERLKDTYDLIVKEDGDQLTVEVVNENLYFYIGIPVIKLSLEIEVPEKEYENIVVTASSGDIELNGLQANELKFETSSGDMEIANLEGDTIKSVASSGTISMKNSSAKNFEFEASSGDVLLENIVGDVKALTSSGSINLDNDEISGNLFAEASSGDVNVAYNEKPTSLLINFEHSSGEEEINIDGVNYEERTDDRIIGKIGSGKYELKIKTSSGDFTLN